MDLSPGNVFPDLALPDHAGNERRLSDLVAGDPTVLHCHRGWWCPPSRRSSVRGARRIHSSVLDADGAAATVSLVLPQQGVRLAFDDVAVQQARRAVLLAPPADAISTLLTDASHFEGSVTVFRGADALARALDDPFARIFPARLLRVGPGLFGRAPAPAGPTIERYGSAQPWPGDRFRRP